jgi:hypothetical protein
VPDRSAETVGSSWGKRLSLYTIDSRNLDDLEEQSKPVQDLGKLVKFDGLYDVIAAPQIMTDLDLTRD